MKYIIICEERGIFLGTYDKFGFFSKVEDFGCYKVPTFVSEEEAKKYANKFMDKEKKHDYLYPYFDTNDRYVSCIDIIKAGYGKYTGEMISNLPNYVDTMH